MTRGGMIESWEKFLELAGRDVAVVGGGGKTGLLNLMEARASAAGRPALITVTTRLGRDQLTHLERIEAADLPEALAAARLAARGERLVLAGPPAGRDKYAGLPLDWFGPLRRAAGADCLFLVEADGSTGRPLKAHGDHEPLLPPLDGLHVAAVLGLAALLRPWPEAVHRPEILQRHIETPDGAAALSPEAVAAFVQKAWRRFKPDLIFLNQSDLLNSRSEKELGRALADLLTADGWTVFCGSVRAQSALDRRAGLY